MLFSKHIVSTRTLLQLTVALVFSVAGVGAAVAAGPSYPPLLVPYTIYTVVGTPFYFGTATSPAAGYFGDGVPATPTGVANLKTSATMDGPVSHAVDSVGNIYIGDTANFIIREVNSTTGLINTIAGVDPKGCSGTVCTIRTSGCADGVPAAGNPIGSSVQGIAVDAYGNVYFDDSTTASVSVVYRGGTQVANFIKLVNPAGVATSGGTVQPGYVYHVGGAVNLTTCSGTLGNVDNGLAYANTASGTPTAELHGPGFLTLDSAGNIYISDNSNSTVRVINTQATAQTFFQYVVQPGFMRSITNCNALLTAPCPSGAVTATANTGINGPANGIVFNSQYREAEVDAFGNVYQFNGTGSGTGPPGIYAAAAYAGGAPLTNLLVAEAPSLAAYYGPTPGNAPAELNSSGLPTYGDGYIVIGNPDLTSTLPGSFPDVYATQNEDLDIRSSSLLPDNFGTLWFNDNHYPEIVRIDQYTSLATDIIGSTSMRGTASVANVGAQYLTPASFTNPWYCVYGSSGNLWSQGPQTFDPQGDGCPAILGFYSGGVHPTISDGLGNIYLGDGGENLIRELPLGNTFPATPVGTATPVTHGIQVHFSSTNPPQIGLQIPDANLTGSTTTAFSIAPGTSDFTINTTTPEFPMGSNIQASDKGYAFGSNTPNFLMFVPSAPANVQNGVTPTGSCTQLGVQPTAVSNPSNSDYDCLVYVSFNPTEPGLRTAQLQVNTTTGNVYYFQLTGIGTGGQLAIDGGAPTTVAATGLGATAQIAVTQSGTLYIADPSNNRIVVEPAGGGTQAALPITGVTPATLSGPMGVAVDAANNVYVSDTGNNRILKVNPVTGAATVLGNYVWVSGNAATAPPQYAFKGPQGLAVDTWDNVYVADTGNGKVVEITSNIALGGAVPLLNYPGAPTFVQPEAVAVDSHGNIYVADPKVAGTQIIELPPGGGDLVNVPGSQFPFPGIGTGLKSPDGVAVDAAGNVYISDSTNNTVTEVPAATGPGSSPFVLNFSQVNSSGVLTGLSAPAGLALDANGNLYVSDSGNKRILFDNRQTPLVNFGTAPQGQATAVQPICANSNIQDGFNDAPANGAGCVLTVTNVGNTPVTLANPITTVAGTTNAAYGVSSNCATITGATNILPAGLTCTISPTFTAPNDNGQNESFNVNGGPQLFSLVSNGSQPQAKIVLTSSAGTSPAAGATPTITATVTQPSLPGVTPTGNVTFTYVVDAINNNVNSCGTGGTLVAPLSGSGGTATATLPLPALAQGVQYTITANYAGDSQNSAAPAAPLLLTVPGVTVTATVTSTAAQLTFIYGGTPPTVVGAVAPAPPSGITVKFGSNALATTPIGTYPVTVSFSGSGSCAYGFPPSVYSTGGAAVVTENPAPLTYKIPNFTTLYGALNLSYGASAVVTGAVNGDTFSATFVPSQSSILNVGTYSVVPTVTGSNAGNYTVTAPPSTLVVNQAPVGLSVTAAKTAVLNTAAGVAAATFQVSVNTSVTAGKGVPTGSVTVQDTFTPIGTTAPGTGTTVPSCSTLFIGSTTSGSPNVTGVDSTFGLAASEGVTGAGIPTGATITAVSALTNSVTLSANATATTGTVLITGTVTGTCNATTSLPLVAGVVTYTPTNIATGIHQFDFAYSGDSNFLPTAIAPNSTALPCAPAPAAAITPNCLTVDVADFTLSSIAGTIIVIPGTVPSGNGLLVAPNQSSAAPETAVLFVNALLGFTGSVNVTCQTQNPYVTCFMTPTSVCFVAAANSSCSNTATTAAVVVAVETPATLPLGYSFGNTAELRTSVTRTVLAFLPFGVLAFCVRRRRRLSKALWMLMVISAVSAGMSGCGGNQVNFYTPIPTGPQTVTVIATYPTTGVTRSYTLPINID